MYVVSFVKNLLIIVQFN